MSRLLSLSERRRRTARINGAKSRGPVTAAGKARSSRNAVTHGLRSAGIFLEELPPDFAEESRKLIDSMNPATPLERDLAQDIALAAYRLNRIARLEAAAFNAEIARLPGFSRDETLATAFHRLVENGTLSTLLRYHTAEDNRWSRAFNQFMDGRRTILKKCSAPNEPTTHLTRASTANSGSKPGPFGAPPVRAGSVQR
jgi:hypothetical protein